MLKDKEIAEIKKKENTYIMNLDCAYLYRSVAEKGEFLTKDIDKIKLYTATIPYSLEMIRLDEMYPKEVNLEKDKKQYTKAIINVNFDNNYFEWYDFIDKETGEAIRKKNLKMNKKKLRKHIYVNGFKLDGIDYIFYKRGASKARTGSDLFIKKDMYDKLMNRSRLIFNGKGLIIEEGEECDITSLNAYQSLILSGLEDVVHIDPKSILLIEDINSSPFKSKASTTRQINGELVTKNEIVERINNMTDGQGLADESIFKSMGREKKGMALLRTDFSKCCAFNTKIQVFFKKHFGDEYEEAIITDMFGNKIKAKDVRLITTPSSIKLLKFAYKFKSKAECYNYWRNNIDDVFGVVKSDKIGNYGTWNRTTYQILNSMPFTKEQIKELAKDELVYVDKLKNDLAYFKNHIAIKNEEVELLEDNIDKLLIAEENDEEYAPKDKSYKTSELVNNLLAINSDFQYTPLFKTWRRDQIIAYMNELRRGKLRLKDTIYCTIVANPYEMLLHSVGEYKGVCLAKGTEVYCGFYKEGQELATFRNPHINCGNVMVSTNKKHDEYRYFNLTDNILIINVSDNDFPDRGQGFDYDSDTLLMTPHKIMVEIAKYCQRYLTPLNMVKGDSKKRLNTLEQLATLDSVLSNNFIGKIINKSQIGNSYMWHLAKSGADEEVIDKLYNVTSMLSSLSQIELDKAKKSFDNISMPKELKKVNDTQYDGKNIIRFNSAKGKNKDGEEIDIKNMVVPNFFKYVAQDNTYRDLEYFETPMDYLQEIIDGVSKKYKSTKRLDIITLLVKEKNIEGKRNMIEQHEKIFDIISKCGNKINSCNFPTSTLNDKGKKTVKQKAKKDAINKLENMKINSRTILGILKKSLSKDKQFEAWRKHGMLTLNLLYYSHPLELLSVFKNNNTRDYILKLDNRGEVNIFDNKYILIKKTT
jgi:hypothetical protein